MRFAYLIMAHDNENQLKLLITLLDYSENDIYLHIDKKNKDIDLNVFKTFTHYARIFVYSKYKVYWGDLSQTKCQFFLLSEAIKLHYDYYHLISGHDLPIKRHQDILNYFQLNYDKEFVHFESYQLCEKETCIRFHFLQGIINRVSNVFIRKILMGLEKGSLYLQTKWDVRRDFYCGANWFSITHRLATDLVYNQNNILKKVAFTISSDEYVLQTYLFKRKEKYNLISTEANDYQAIMRAIDWERGTPYVWRASDYKYLVYSPYLYARKFDEKIDNQIINKISDYLLCREKKEV